jgi:hypothetical protein
MCVMKESRLTKPEIVLIGGVQAAWLEVNL